MMSAHTIRNRAGEAVRREYDGKVWRSSDQQDAPLGKHIDTYEPRPLYAEQIQREAEVVNRDWRFPLLLAGAALLVAATAIGMGALLDFVTTDLVEMTR